MKPSFVTKYGVLYQSDCLEFLSAVPRDSIDCVFADPPFNLGKEYKNGKSDSLQSDQYLNWCRLWISEIVRVLKPGGAIFVYIVPRWGYHLASYLEEQQMEFRHWIALSMKGTFPRGKKLAFTMTGASRYTGSQREGRIQSAERAVPTLTRTTKVTNLLSA